MKVQIEDISNLERKLTIEIGAADVDKEFTRAYKSIQQNAEIKGFRKGKAPIQKIQSLYGDQVRGDVTQNIVQDSYVKALQDKKLQPVAMPDIQLQGEPEQGKDFSFTAQFEVQPEITLSQLKDLPVQKEKLNIDDSRIDKTLDDIRQSHAVMEDVKIIRETQNGDHAKIDFEGFIDDAPMDNGSAKGHVLEIGSNSFIPGFEEGIVGMKPGENKNIHLTFPEDYQAEHLKGQKVRFAVTLHGLQKKTLPEWTPEFAAKLGDYKTVDEVKAAVRKDLEKSEEQRVRSDLKSRLFKSLIAHNVFEAPKSLILSQRQALVDDFKQRMQQQGMSPDEFAQYEQKWAEDFNDTAEYMVKSALLIQKIADQEKLTASDADVEAKFQQVSGETGVDIARVREYYSQNQGEANLRFQITEDNVFDFLLKDAKVEEVEKDKLQDDAKA